MFGRARHSVRAGTWIRSGVQRTAHPTFPRLHDAWLVITLHAWVCPSAKNCLTQFHNRWPMAVGFFITINCLPRGKNQLCRAGAGDAVLAAVKFNHERFVWHCRLRLLMPDHLHAIIAFPRAPGMQTTVKNWKKFIAGEHGVEWHRDFFRSPFARSSRTGRENQLHPNESCS
jgi:hypothetical protein